MAAVLLVVAAWLGLRRLLEGRCRALFPRLHGTAMALMVFWAGVVLLLATRAPAWLLPLAGVAAVAMTVSAWRHRAAYGRARGLPPGSLSWSGSIEAILDRGFYLEQARRHGPIFKMAQFHRGAVCIVGLERGHRLLRLHERSLGPSPLPFTQDISGGFLRYMSDETHSRYGPLIRRALSRQGVEPSALRIAETSRRELAAAADAALRSGSGGIHPTPFFERLVYDSFLWTLFAITPGTDPYERMGELYTVLARQNLSRRLTAPSRRALHGLTELIDRQAALLREAMTQGRAPVCTLTELHRMDRAMPDSTCIHNLVFILRISTANVVGLLAWVTRMLGEHPEYLERIREEGSGAERQDSRADLVDRVIFETLRLAQSEYIYRTAREDVWFDGVRIPKGWWVRICVWESHRSDEWFAEPEAFRPDRFLPSPPGQAAYSPFGSHQHACNGVPLTMAICRSVVLELADGEWTIEDDGGLARDFRHWSHWRPGPGLRVRPKAARTSSTPR